MSFGIFWKVKNGPFFGTDCVKNGNFEVLGVNVIHPSSSHF